MTEFDRTAAGRVIRRLWKERRQSQELLSGLAEIARSHLAMIETGTKQPNFDTENRLKYSFQSVFNAVPALHFRDDKVSIAKIRLVPITVSQLKCALHILIGDWYETLWRLANALELPPHSLVALIEEEAKSRTPP